MHPEDPSTQHLSAKAVEALRAMSEGTWGGELADGEIHVMRTHLPEHVVLSIARQGHGPVWVILDCDQPDTTRHLRELLTHWPDGVDPGLAQIACQIARALDAQAADIADDEAWADEEPDGPATM